MSLVKIRAALETKLNAMAPALATQWENASFDPEAGVPYQSAWLLPADPQNPTLGHSFHRESGFFQVMLCYPVNVGSRVAIERAELLKSSFARGVTLENQGITVTINRTPAIAPAMVNDDRYCVPVRIPYHADVYLVN